jgi:hypothetical protein
MYISLDSIQVKTFERKYIAELRSELKEIIRNWVQDTPVIH